MRSLLCFVLFSVSIACLPAAAQEPAKGITATTYNIRYASPRDGDDIWENRKEFVAKYVADWDVVGMQEVTVGQMDYLRKHLPDYDSYGVGRDDGKAGGEFSPVFYRRDRFDCLDQGTFWLSESPETVGEKSWDAALPRICSWVVLQEKSSGKKFLLANTHFDHRGQKARHESAKLAVRLIPELAKGLPVVFMGDFNCAPKSDPYESLVSGFGSAREISKSPAEGPDGTFNGFKAIANGRIIDHIFVKDFVVLDYHVDDPRTDKGRFASDHLPVRVTLGWPDGK